MCVWVCVCVGVCVCVAFKVWSNEVLPSELQGTGLLYNNLHLSSKYRFCKIVSAANHHIILDKTNIALLINVCVSCDGITSQ